MKRPDVAKKISDIRITYFVDHPEKRKEYSDRCIINNPTSNPDVAKKQSNSLKKYYEDNPGVITGSKHYQRTYYTQPDGKEVLLKSSYELRYAQILDYMGVNWAYESKSYILHGLDDSTFHPDFYLPDIDLWVDPKGYVRPESKAKIIEFSKEYPEEANTLLILYIDQLDALERKIMQYQEVVDLRNFGVPIKDQILIWQ